MTSAPPRSHLHTAAAGFPRPQPPAKQLPSPGQPRPRPRITDAQLWCVYHAARANRENPAAIAAARNDLALRYAALVTYHAGRIHAKIHGQVELDDLISDGQFGLLQAIEKFEPAGGWKFETYAYPRIRGAILDAIRNADWVPRSERKRARITGTASPTITSLWRPLLENDGHTDRVRADLLIDQKTADPSGNMNLRQQAVTALRGLSRRHRCAFLFYYADGLNMKQTGLAIGVSQSRASEILTQAKAALKANLDHLGKTDLNEQTFSRIRPNSHRTHRPQTPRSAAIA